MRVKTEARRLAIMEAAETIFHRDGFERASMAQICAEVGFSKATLYSYYKSKDELFFDVMLTAAQSEFSTILENLKNSQDTTREALFNYSKQLLTFLYSPRIQAIRRLVASEAGRSDLGRQCFEQGPKQGLVEMAAFMQSQIDAGKLKSGDPVLMGEQLRALLEARWTERFLFQMLDNISEQEIEQSVEEALDVFLAAYAI